jgi:hypothetical protein
MIHDAIYARSATPRSTTSLRKCRERIEREGWVLAVTSISRILRYDMASRS